MSLLGAHSGFTVVELLITITVIGVMSSLVMNSVQHLRENAQAEVVLNNFQQIEKALQLLAIDEGISAWWPESEFGTGNNPSMSDMMSNENRLGKYLQEISALPNGVDASFHYDSDGDSSGLCAAVPYEGVNIGLRDAGDWFDRMDEQVDRGDGPLCGRLRMDTPGSGGADGDVWFQIDSSQQSFVGG